MNHWRVKRVMIILKCFLLISLVLKIQTIAIDTQSRKVTEKIASKSGHRIQIIIIIIAS